MHKYMIQAATAEELKEKILDMARLLKGDDADSEPTVLHSFTTPTAEEKEMTREEAVQARIDAAFSSPPPAPEEIAPPQDKQEVIGEVDSRGVPWNSSYHSETKSKNKDGSWRGRRGVDKDAIKKYEDQFRVSNQVQAPAPAPAPATVEVSPEMPPLPPQPTGKPTHSFQTFKSSLALVLAELINAGKIDQNWLKAVYNHYKVEGIEALMKNEALLEDFFNQLAATGLINKIG